MLLVLHVDEVDDDDPAQVAQAQLAGDRGGRLEVGLEDGFLEVAMADEGAGVHVDGGHRLGRIDDQVAAGLQQYLALQGFLDFVLDAVEIEDRSLARVMFEAIGNLRHQFFDEGSDLLEVLSRVDADLLDPRVHQVAQGTDRQGQVFVDHRRRADGLDLRGDLVP